MRLDVHPKTGEIVFDLIGLTGLRMLISDVDIL